MLLTPTNMFLVILAVFYVPTAFSLSLQKFIDAEALDDLRKSKKMEEFIKHLGIPSTNLCHPGIDKNKEPMFHEDLAFGDMIMDDEEIEKKGGEDEQTLNDVENDFADDDSSPKQTRKKSKKPRKWKDGIVPYHISRDFNSEDRQKIENAIEELNSKIESVHFRPVEQSDRNYVIIFSGNGCYAKVGMAGGQQPVSLQADECLETGTIQHELLHALGFVHEQNRPDRDDYIEVLYENIPEKWQKSYKRYEPYEVRYVGRYDYYSILHYPPEAPKSKGKKLAFNILDDNVDIQWVGNRVDISDKDIEKAEELYSSDEL